MIGCQAESPISVIYTWGQQGGKGQFLRQGQGGVAGETGSNKSGRKSEIYISRERRDWGGVSREV